MERGAGKENGEREIDCQSEGKEACIRQFLFGTGTEYWLYGNRGSNRVKGIVLKEEGDISRERFGERNREMRGSRIRREKIKKKQSERKWKGKLSEGERERDSFKGGGGISRERVGEEARGE